MDLRTNIPSRTGPHVLGQYIIQTEQNTNVPTRSDVYHPILNRIRKNIQEKRCGKCGSTCLVSYGKFGKIKVDCDVEGCDWRCFPCPWCSKLYKNFQNTSKHAEDAHGHETSCPFCSIPLPQAVNDKLTHVLTHISGRLERLSRMDSTEDDFGDEEQVILPLRRQNSFPGIFPHFHQTNEEETRGSVSNGEYNDEPGELLSDEDEDEGEGDGSSEPMAEPGLQHGSSGVYNKRTYMHIKSLQEEFVFTRKSSRGFNGLVINPLEARKEGDFDVFYDSHNLRLAKFARKTGLSEGELKELIEDLEVEYESPKTFYSAETLLSKVHDLGGQGRIRYEACKCSNGHKVCVIPIEEGMRILFSKKSFLMNFHVREWPVGEDEPYMNFRQSEKFIQESRRNRDRHRCHYFSFQSNRDKFPGLLTSMLPLLGYYWNCGNLDYPECMRHVTLFAFVMECKSCVELVDEKFISNVNRLSEESFLVYHPLLGSFVEMRMEYDVESDDSPQVAENTMSKGVTGRNFCSQCGEHMDNYTNSTSYRHCCRKKLVDTEELYKQCFRMSSNSRHGDGTLTRIHKIEDKNGRTFTESKYNKEKGMFMTQMKKPTSFFNLNDYTKRNIAIPPGPFHSLLKGFVLHVKDGLFDKLTNRMRDRVQVRWESLEFPEGVKKPKNMWDVGGNNFDGISALVFGLPYAITKVVPARLSQNIRLCFNAIAALLNPGFSKKQLKQKKNDYFTSVPVIAQFIDIGFPTTHQTFHVWDRVIPPKDLPTPSTPNNNQKPPPEGPILCAMGDTVIVIGLGSTRSWDEKKFEVFHKRFKKKMKKCNLKNPSMFLLIDYISDEMMFILYPDEKWIWFSPYVQYIPFKQKGVLQTESKKMVMYFLKIGAYDVEDVDFIRIRELRVFTKVFRTGNKVVIGGGHGEWGNIKYITYLCWSVGTQFEESEIVVVYHPLGDVRVQKVVKVDKVLGKPIKKDRKLKGVVC